ncbi:MAG: hypothetical protein J5905_06175 [Prevotella sp.]|nr:hypothetical protein [Prevotella sp.]
MFNFAGVVLKYHKTYGKMKRYALLAHWKPEKFLIERKRVWRFTFIAWTVYTIRAQKVFSGPPMEEWT